MEPLRWILLLAGLALIGAIYWLGRRPYHGRHDEGLVERARRDADSRPTIDPLDPDAAPEAAHDEPDLDLADFDVTGPQMRCVDGAGDDDTDIDGADRHAAVAHEPGADAQTAVDPESASTSSVMPATELGPMEGEDESPAIGPESDSPAMDPDPDRDPAPAPDLESEPGPEPAGGTGLDSSVAREADSNVTAVDASAPAEERVVVLYVVAADGERLVGARLREALEQRGLRHGRHDIFHATDNEGSSVFSVANVTEPGTFDPATMDTLTTPGIALFMQVPGAQAAETALDRLLATARSLADALDAHVLDERNSTLTRQTEQHLREQLRALDRRNDQRR